MLNVYVENLTTACMKLVAYMKYFKEGLRNLDTVFNIYIVGTVFNTKHIVYRQK